MPAFIRSLAIFLITTSFALAQEEETLRTWTSANGTKTLQARYVSHDSEKVKLLGDDEQEVSIELANLHKKDREYLEKTHPKDVDGTIPGNAYGPLNFGDNRTLVQEKLLNCPLVKTELNENLFGRTGLNGIFETTQKMGDLPCFLYFHWDPQGGLKEVTLRTEHLPESEYSNKLQATWSEMSDLFGTLFGNATSESSYPRLRELEDGLMLSSHLWRTDEGHSVLLGIGQEQSKYAVSARFTTERVQPVITP
jgi:hypothetical protein